MSSILKALKKIDASSSPDDNGAPWPHPGAAGDAITRNIKRRWFIRRMTTYILVAACVLSLAILLYLRQADKASRARTAEIRSETHAQQNQLDRAKLATTARVRRPSPTVPAADTSRNTAPADRAGEPLPKKSMKAATRTVPRAQEKTSRPAPSKGNTTGPSTAPPPAEKSTRYSRLQRTGIVLQAIAWAPEPSKRIAVVNGSVVKEGDSVEGYTLMQIRKEDIVLNDGGKTWQLEFGLRH